MHLQCLLLCIVANIEISTIIRFRRCATQTVAQLILASLRREATPLLQAFNASKHKLENPIGSTGSGLWKFCKRLHFS